MGGCALATHLVVAFMTAFYSFVLFAVRSGIDNVPLQRFLAGSAWFLFRCTFFLALLSAA